MSFPRPITYFLALVAALLCAGGATAASARAQVSWVVHGHGFGHGVGMSAYGAYGYALHGKGYKFILGHYYRGTSLGTVSGPNVVRVLLTSTAGDVTFSEATGACGTKLEPTATYEAHRVGQSVVLRNSTGKPLARCGATLRAAGANGIVNIGGVGRYRGALETVVNECRRTERGQRALARQLRQRRDPERVAALLADGRAEGAGGGVALLRPDRRGRRRRLRPLLRHPQPGLQRPRIGVHDLRPGRGRDRRARC